jgi:hypothetical protein
MPTPTFSHSAWPLKRRSHVRSLGVTSKMPMSTFTDSALPLKRWFRVRLLGVTSKTLMSTFNRSVLLLKRRCRLQYYSAATSGSVNVMRKLFICYIKKKPVQQSEKVNHRDGANDSSSLRGS